MNRITWKRLLFGLVFTELTWASNGWKGWWLAYFLAGLWSLAFLTFCVWSLRIYLRRKHNGKQ